jgi:putative membrane protein
MKKISLCLMLALSAWTFQACNENKRNSDDSVENAHDANDLKEQAGTGEKDDENDFAVKAANGGMFEMEMAKLAQEKSQNAQVKEFADMMIKDHSAANEELKALASRKNITLPTTLGKDKQEDVDEMAKLSGAEFDKKYVDAMVEDHEEDVKLFQEASISSEDPDLKTFAGKTLPTLQKHLERITTIDKNMDQ